MPTSPGELRRTLRRARHVLGMTQTELGRALGASRRTIVRRERGHSSHTPDELRHLAGLVRAEDADLADELLAAAGLPHADEPAQPSAAAASNGADAPPAPCPSWTHKHAVDAVLYAAANAVDTPPREIAPAIAAAFVRAKEIGLPIDVVVDELSSRSG